MFVETHALDPYPGRCGCMSFNPRIGQYERCLGYQDDPHVCYWEDAPMPQPGVSGQIASTPSPWVEPRDEDGGPHD